MFFILSKTVTVFAQPSNLILLIGLCGLVLLLTRWRGAAVRLIAASVVLLFVGGILPVGKMLTHSLESRFPPWSPSVDAGADAGRGAPAGIIILGGGLSPGYSRGDGAPGLNIDSGRVIGIAHLARQFPQARIIYAGGDASLAGNKNPEANHIGPLLDDFGVPRARVELETRSRNTAENAAFSKALARPKPGERWLLVTSAQHMPRAIGCFRHIGFPVEAYPVAWQTERDYHPWPSATVGRNLERLDRATNEWIGLIVYWLTGRTSALLPAP